MGYTFDERENTFSVLKVLFLSVHVLFLSVLIETHFFLYIIRLFRINGLNLLTEN